MLTTLSAGAQQSIGQCLITIYLIEYNHYHNDDNIHTCNDDKDDEHDEVSNDESRRRKRTMVLAMNHDDDDDGHLPMMFTAMSSIPVTSCRLA